MRVPVAKERAWCTQAWPQQQQASGKLELEQTGELAASSAKLLLACLYI